MGCWVLGLVGQLPMWVLNSGGSTVHYCKLLSTHVIKAILQVLLAHYFLASYIDLWQFLAHFIVGLPIWTRSTTTTWGLFTLAN